MRTTTLVLAAWVAGTAGGCVLPPTSSPDAGAPTQDLAARIENAMQHCTPIPGVTPYSPDVDAPATLLPCALPGAIAWRSDLDVDCDGGRQPSCKADPAYQAETSITGSDDRPLDANTVPFIVVPLPGHGFDYAAHGLILGNAALVSYRGHVVAGVFGDEGPPDILGEASFAMAQRLGIDPDPVTGGADEGAVFIVFTGSDAQVDPVEDNSVAEQVALARASTVVP